MRYRLFYITKLVFILLFPISVFGQTVCSSVGYTILTINGIWTNEREAQTNKKELERFFPDGTFQGEKLIIDFLHNPSHIGGAGDMVKVVKQMLADGRTVDDYDLREMLAAASEKVRTRKILFVGHSQGNFYANGMYDVLGGGVSIGVYGVATPAPRVAGEGEYLTSSTDQVIADLAASVAFRLGSRVLPPNTDIAEVAGDTSRGHSFSGVYLRERAAEIVAGLERALGKLHTRASYTSILQNTEIENTRCIPAQTPTLAHKLKGALYAVVDPAASEVRDNLAKAGGNIAKAARALARAADRALSSAPLTIENSSTVLTAGVGAAVATADYPTILQNTAIDNVEAGPLISQNPSPQPPSQREGGEGGVVPSPLGRGEEGGVANEPVPGLSRSDVLENIRIYESVPISPLLPVYAPVPLPTGVSPGFGGGGGGSGGGSSAPAAASVSAPTPEPTPAATSYPSPAAGDIVINEIAWSGTEASAAHEWIELYNRTAQTLSLSSTTLFAADGSPYLALSGTIAPYAYYLIEADDTAVSNINADLVADFGTRLSDTTGEALTLAYFNGSATTTIDAFDDFSCVNWCGFGSGSPNFLSLERLAPDLPGTEQTSWGQNRGYQNGFRNGTAQNGAALNGTPKRRNYSNYLVNYGSNLTSGTLTLTAARSPYFVDNVWFTVASGATLSVEAGSVVKFLNTAGIRVNGTMNVSGSTSTSTVFTSFLDDEYGGDLNGDGSNTSPQAGNWFGVEFLSGSTGTIDRATLRYGGKYFSSGEYTRAVFSAANSSPTLTNSVIEKSRAYGVSLAYASSTISGNTIRNNNYESDTVNSYGLYGWGGAPTISGNSFSNNYRGMFFWNSSGAFTNNSFTNNTQNAFTWAGDLLAGGSITGNSGSGNGASNGIALQSGALMSSGAGVASTFGKNTLFPYLLTSSASVPVGATLTAAAGSVWKFGNNALNIYGTLAAQGTAAEPVLFTSISDDADGNDAQANGSTTPTVFPSAGISIQSGGAYTLSNTEIRYLNFATSTP